MGAEMVQTWHYTLVKAAHPGLKKVSSASHSGVKPGE